MKQFPLSAVSGRWMGPFPDGSPAREGERSRSGGAVSPLGFTPCISGLAGA